MNAAMSPHDFLSAETLADPFAVYQSALAQGPGGKVKQDQGSAKGKK